MCFARERATFRRIFSCLPERGMLAGCGKVVARQFCGVCGEIFWLRGMFVIVFSPAISPRQKFDLGLREGMVH
jgi:hypothetical protein